MSRVRADPTVRVIAEITGERLSPDQPHDEVDPLVWRAEPTELVHGDDVRVLELAGDLRLPDQPPLGVEGVLEVVPQDLHRQVAVEDVIVDTMDHSHAPDANHVTEPIAGRIAGDQPRVPARGPGIGRVASLVRGTWPIDGGIGRGMTLSLRLEQASEGQAVLGEEPQIHIRGAGAPRPTTAANVFLDDADHRVAVVCKIRVSVQILLDRPRQAGALAAFDVRQDQFDQHPYAVGPLRQVGVNLWRPPAHHASSNVSQRQLLHAPGVG